MQPSIVIDGYLVQEKLETALRGIFGEEAFVGREIRVPGTRKRWDMQFTVAGQTLIVEFDGDNHYRDSLLILSDEEKDAIARTLGYKTIRIPYWVQLTSETFRHFFSLQAEILQTFPHGFIASKVFPASYSELGLARFLQELRGLPQPVQQAVKDSLRARASEYGSRYVYPLSSRAELTSQPK